MAIPADFGASYVPARARPTVLCVACRSRFDADGATTGDRVRCPMCREVVELAQVIAERRRHRLRRTPAFSEPRRLRSREMRAVTFWILVALALTAFCFWSEPILEFVNGPDATDSIAPK